MANHSVVIDSGTFFEIVPNARKIIVPAEYKVIGTEGDHLSEQLTFRCPKLIDGHDIAGCARHYITWNNVKGDVGHDSLEIANSDNEYIYFAWTIRDALAVAAGIVSFSVHFEDLDANDKLSYRWSTTTCKDCEILESINAFLSTYEAIYVSGDTLVIADYTLVKNETLSLETNGLIPEGTIKITRNGSYDVGKYAEIEVAVGANAPQIKVSKDGVITASEGGVESQLKLSAEEDPDFIAKNIKNGVNIFGVEGNYVPTTADEPDLLPWNIVYPANIFGVQGKYPKTTVYYGTIRNLTSTDYEILYTVIPTNDDQATRYGTGVTLRSETVKPNEAVTIDCIKMGLVLCIPIQGGHRYITVEDKHLDMGVTSIEQYIEYGSEIGCFIPLMHSFEVELHEN